MTAPLSTAAALRREVKKETEAPATEQVETAAETAEEAEEDAAVEKSTPKPTGPVLLEPKGGDEYRPKDAELGIKNAANTKELVADTKAEPKDGLQGVTAPPVTLFAWYILPVAAVGGYLLFVRSRRSKQKAYRQVPRK